MKVLRPGMTCPEVEAWQNFLVGRGFGIVVDGDFGTETTNATKSFQKSSGLRDDGVVGNNTYGAAIALGFKLIEDELDDDKYGPNWPPPPSFGPLSASNRTGLFGAFSYVPAPIPGNPEGIRIVDNWATNNIVSIEVPQLKGIVGAPSSCKVPFHVRGAKQLQELFQSWEDLNLIDRVLTWAGTWNPRFVRGSRTYLSNHAWGTAFDINAAWNGFGATPATLGKKGCVRELVDVALEHGFYWGGWFGRSDGMHFELFEIQE